MSWVGSLLWLAFFFRGISVQLILEGGPGLKIMAAVGASF